MDSVALSYASHGESFTDALLEPENEKKANSWFDETTADYWRHRRGYQIIEGLSRNTTWLTVGDGRYGLDSIRMKRLGFQNVLPTDICEALLKESKNRDLIAEYRVLNAERMDLEDKTFDYVFCKEAFHHFPRPYLALYEMLRVARKGVVLTEPNDISPKITTCYEPVGNFSFCVSLREMIKLALAMNLPAICYYGYNDAYISGCEFEPANTDKSTIFREMVTQIKAMDAKVVAGEQDYNMISIILFNEIPSSEEKVKLQEEGCCFIELPCNPYLVRFGDITEKYFIYGTGGTGRLTAEYCKNRGYEICGYVDSNSMKWDTKYDEKTVISPEALKRELKENVKVIIASLYFEEIEKNLLALGINQERILIAPYSRSGYSGRCV